MVESVNIFDKVCVEEYAEKQEKEGFILPTEFR
jgi:hypothetical protein